MPINCETNAAETCSQSEREARTGVPRPAVRWNRIKKAIPGDFNRNHQFVPAALQVPFLGRDEPHGFHGACAAGSRFQQLHLGPAIPPTRTAQHEVLGLITLGIAGLLRAADDSGLSNYPVAPSQDKLLADFFVMHCKEQSRLIGKAAFTSKLAGLQRCQNARGLLCFSLTWPQPMADTSRESGWHQ